MRKPLDLMLIAFLATGCQSAVEENNEQVRAKLAACRARAAAVVGTKIVGCIYGGSDVGSPPEEWITEDTDVYALRAPTDADGGMLWVDGHPIEGEPVTTKTDGEGFYELSISPGQYRVCIFDSDCKEDIMVEEGQVVRLEYDGGSGRRWFMLR